MISAFALAAAMFLAPHGHHVQHHHHVRHHAAVVAPGAAEGPVTDTPEQGRVAIGTAIVQHPGRTLTVCQVGGVVTERCGG